mmetsp:Transcript_2648/g.6700  ORF Transcript_2648/g.6700 Transcript_2648/m.6700 type:complete len:228 (-) Transcript_2648:714-1397(-)
MLELCLVLKLQRCLSVHLRLFRLLFQHFLEFVELRLGILTLGCLVGQILLEFGHGDLEFGHGGFELPPETDEVRPRRVLLGQLVLELLLLGAAIYPLLVQDLFRIKQLVPHRVDLHKCGLPQGTLVVGRSHFLLGDFPVCLVLRFSPHLLHRIHHLLHRLFLRVLLDSLGFMFRLLPRRMRVSHRGQNPLRGLLLVERCRCHSGLRRLGNRRGLAHRNLGQLRSHTL